MQPLGEQLLDFFNNDVLSINKSGPLEGLPSEVFITRNQRFELELQVTFSGFVDHDPPDVPLGTIYLSEDTIEFSSQSGAVYNAIGLLNINRSVNSKADGTKTKYTYSVDKLEMSPAIIEDTAFVIEWVGNLSKRLIGNSNLSTTDLETSDIHFGSEDSLITIKRANEFRGSMRVLNINISGTDIFIVNTRDSDYQKSTRSGFILYNSDTTIVERQKMRDSISFILGLPIVLFGYTEYSASGNPLYMRSYPVYTFGGKAFELIDLPPYPVASGHFRNSPLMDALNKAINALYENYDRINFDQLSWTYWHGVCAPATMSAVYFAGLCEQVQRVAKKIFESKNSTLIDDELWRPARIELSKIIEAIDADSVSKNILKNKVSGLNQLPQSVALDRLLKLLDLSISDAEKAAWKHRNSAAHGGMSSNSDDIVFNSKLLQLMLHRLLAAITNCSESYVDYYNLNFPIRLLSSEIPARAI